MSKKKDRKVAVAVAAGLGALLVVFGLSIAVFAFIVAPLIMVGAAALHVLFPGVPAIGYLTSLVISGVLWIGLVIKKVVFG